MKSTILLATTLFLASAPSPDAKTVSELSAGFLSAKNDYALMASENSLRKQHHSSFISERGSQPVTELHELTDQDTAHTDHGIDAPEFQAQIN